MQTLVSSWPLLALLLLSPLLYYLGTWLLRQHANKQREIGTPVYTMKDAAILNAEAARGMAERTATIVSTSQTIKFVMVFVLSGCVWAPLGYFYRGDHDKKARYTYEDVLITARKDASHFTLQPARMQPFETGLLCNEETDPDYWQEFQKFETLTFSLGKLPDGRDCKDVEFGGHYSFYMKDGKPIRYTQEMISNVQYQTPSPR